MKKKVVLHEEGLKMITFETYGKGWRWKAELARVVLTGEEEDAYKVTVEDLLVALATRLRVGLPMIKLSTSEGVQLTGGANENHYRSKALDELTTIDF